MKNYRIGPIFWSIFKAQNWFTFGFSWRYCIYYVSAPWIPGKWFIAWNFGKKHCGTFHHYM